LNSAVKKERALLVALINSEADERSFLELGALAVSAGLEVVGWLAQHKDPTSAALFGKGKLEEMRAFATDNEIDVLICDNELSGTQMRNISDIVDCKALDRSSLILDIFAMRAVTAEGKLQVELAQLKYNLPRLIGVAGRLSKYGGGVGMRGPGEKKLETDRRVISKDIDDLTKRLGALEKQRDLRRSRRRKSDVKTAALVGYTNTGKSSIMNLLCRGGGNPENKLFATLDPVTRKAFIDETAHYLLTDTVGFIDRLPHEFIDAFSSTLEEARGADLLIHVTDLSDENIVTHYETVLRVLSDLGISNKNVLTVYNKTDMALADVALPYSPNSVYVSAKMGDGVAELKRKIAEMLGF
jgi:GTP-binding protein HflX